MFRYVYILILALTAPATFANNSNELLSNVSVYAAKISVEFTKNKGLGSGVVVAKNKVVTNCHVVAGGLSATVMVNQKQYTVAGVTPDWRHDLCVLTVDGLDAPIATVGSSEQLKYKDAVYAVGFAGDTVKPHISAGKVKALYPLDDSVVVQASSAFNKGDSGGGLFNEAGQLVGVIAVKSPGSNPSYYNMSVEWLKGLLDQPVLAFQSKAQRAFWAKKSDAWPHFMQVDRPLKKRDWRKLYAIATDWATQEPQTVEAIFYQAVAQYHLKQTDLAHDKLLAVVNQNNQHSEALHYLDLIAQR